MAQRKKILWLIKGLGSGGAEKLLAMALPHLDHKRFAYEVAYLLPWKNDLVNEFERANIPVFCLNVRKHWDVTAVSRLMRLVREREVHVIHCHLPYTGILGRVAGRLASVPGIVYTEHNVIEKYRTITKLCHVLTYPLNNATIAVSDAVCRSVLRHKMFAPPRLVTIHNGVDLDFIQSQVVCPDTMRENLGIPRNHQLVGNIAHLRPEKGHQYLLQAAKHVIDEYPDVTFIMVGREKIDGYTNRLKRIAAQLGIQDRVVFTGFRRDALQITASIDVFALSSLFEGLPVALMEAMALGKPAVATNVGGVPEVIDDGVDGFVVAPRKPQELAEKILMLLKDDALRRQMSSNAVRKVRSKFTIQRMTKAVEQVYETVMNGDCGH